jgi:hypothetical protein
MSTGAPVTDATPAEPRERELRLRYAGACRDCGTALTAGTRARWHPDRRTIRCLVCPTASSLPGGPQGPDTGLARARENDTVVDWGVAGRSAQRHFDQQQSRRRARLRSRWVAVALASVLGGTGGAVLAAVLHAQTIWFVVVGAVLPVLNLLATPQHIDAWRSGAAGEREVGARLDKLRTAGVLTLHDRRVPGRRTNIDHIAVSSAGVFVIDTKNVVGKVTHARAGLRVAGRRRDHLVTGVQTQVAAVRHALDDQSLPPKAVRGVLCFTRDQLPWRRPSPRGITLLNPRALARTLRKPGPLSPEQVHHLATVLAQRLPTA